MKIKLWQWEYVFDKEDAKIVVPLILLLLSPHARPRPRSEVLSATPALFPHTITAPRYAQVTPQFRTNALRDPGARIPSGGRGVAKSPQCVIPLDRFDPSFLAPVRSDCSIRVGRLQWNVDFGLSESLRSDCFVFRYLFLILNFLEARGREQSLQEVWWPARNQVMKYANVVFLVGSDSLVYFCWCLQMGASELDIILQQSL